jgi:hypothetical protein
VDREGSGAGQKLAPVVLYFPTWGKKKDNIFLIIIGEYLNIGIITCFFGCGLNFEYLSGKTIPDKCKIV